ncbi:MAG: hypothetical protein N2049_11380 [Anaerolineales bacterium]|nr:hypothetical protein [Anaerolineales bacterium]
MSIAIKPRAVVRGMLAGGLLGWLLGLVGLPIYLFIVFESMVIVSLIHCSECDFWEAFFMLLYGMAPALGVLRFGYKTLITVSAISGANGAVAGLVVAVISSGVFRRPFVAITVICGATAIIPVVIHPLMPVGPYVSNNLIFVYVPSILYVSAMAFIGIVLYRYILARTQGT